MRPASQLPAQGITLAMMTHRIHTGENQESDYTIFGFGASQFNFKDVAFPGDLRHCEKCHIPNSQELPQQAGVLPVVNPRGFIKPQGPITAACRLGSRLGAMLSYATIHPAMRHCAPRRANRGTGASWRGTIPRNYRYMG